MAKRGRPSVYHSWREHVVAALIQGGTAGVLRINLFNIVRGRMSETSHNRVTAQELTDFLEALRSEGKVQRFSVPSVKGPATAVYRATTKLVE